MSASRVSSNDASATKTTSSVPKNVSDSCSIPRLVKSCSVVSSLLAASLGPNGSSVLMESAGKVIITRDGTDIMSLLQIDEPVMNLVIKQVIKTCKANGDGAKSCVILLAAVLRSMDNYFDQRTLGRNVYAVDAVSRAHMVRCIDNIKSKLLPEVQQRLLERNAFIISIKDPNFSRTLEILIYSFMLSKTSSLIARSLTNILCQYICKSVKSSVEIPDLVSFLRYNYEDVVFQVYKTPLAKSEVSLGLILTRDVKHLVSAQVSNECKIVLWSIALSESTENIHELPLLHTNNEHQFMQSLLYKNILLDECLKLLSIQGIDVILSSVYFPEWAVATCKSFSVTLVDSIPEDEFQLICSKCAVLPVTCKQELTPSCPYFTTKLHQIVIGTGKYAKLDIDHKQLIICGVTPTQCDQVSKIVLKTVAYLDNWFQDCLAHEKYKRGGKISDIGQEKIPDRNLFYTYSSGYPEIMSSVILNDLSILSNWDDIEKKILTELFLEIPRILHRKADSRIFPKFANQVANVRDALLLGKEMQSSKSHIQSIFEHFNCISVALEGAKTLIKIESIVSSNKRLAACV